MEEDKKAEGMGKDGSEDGENSPERDRGRNDGESTRFIAQVDYEDVEVRGLKGIQNKWWLVYWILNICILCSMLSAAHTVAS